jgi:hypothetical protein
LKFNQDGITTIIGDNEQGKTSILDTIEYLFRGKTMVNDDIIQHGQDKMFAEIDLDEYTVKRIKTKKTDRLEIVNKEGFKLADKPQAFLDRLINELTFDPFPFLNKTGDQKLKFMMDFLRLDTFDLDEQIKQTETDRLVCGREGKNLGEAIEVEKVELVNIQNLLETKDKIDKENTGRIENARAKRDDEVQKAHKFNELQRDRAYDVKAINDGIQLLETDIKVLYADLDEIKQKIKVAEKRRDESIAKQKILPVPEEEIETNIRLDQVISVSTNDITLKIQNAEEINIQAMGYQAYLGKKKAIEKKRKEYEEYTDKIKTLRTDKETLLRKTDTGVQGLEIKEDGLYFNDIYSENWSDAQGIKIACDLCISMNPKLRAVFVDRGESFGHKRFAELESWAKVNDIQVIITKVVDSEPKSMPENTYYILEGRVK